MTGPYGTTIALFPYGKRNIEKFYKNGAFKEKLMREFGATEINLAPVSKQFTIGLEGFINSTKTIEIFIYKLITTSGDYSPSNQKFSSEKFSVGCLELLDEILHRTYEAVGLIRAMIAMNWEIEKEARTDNGSTPIILHSYGGYRNNLVILHNKLLDASYVAQNTIKEEISFPGVVPTETALKSVSGSLARQNKNRLDSAKASFCLFDKAIMALEEGKKLIIEHFNKANKPEEKTMANNINAKDLETPAAFRSIPEKQMAKCFADQNALLVIYSMTGKDVNESTIDTYLSIHNKAAFGATVKKMDDVNKRYYHQKDVENNLEAMFGLMGEFRKAAQEELKYAHEAILLVRMMVAINRHIQMTTNSSQQFACHKYTLNAGVEMYLPYKGRKIDRSIYEDLLYKCDDSLVTLSSRLYTLSKKSGKRKFFTKTPVDASYESTTLNEACDYVEYFNSLLGVGRLLRDKVNEAYAMLHVGNNATHFRKRVDELSEKSIILDPVPSFCGATYSIHPTSGGEKIRKLVSINVFDTVEDRDAWLGRISEIEKDTQVRVPCDVKFQVET